MRVFIGKHPCDDQPYIVDIEPDPRSDEWKARYAYQPLDGEPWDASEDYSGWYIREALKDENCGAWWAVMAFLGGFATTLVVLLGRGSRRRSNGIYK